MEVKRYSLYAQFLKAMPHHAQYVWMSLWMPVAAHTSDADTAWGITWYNWYQPVAIWGMAHVS